MKWMDHEAYVELYPPTEINYEECVVFLGRSDQEVLHRIKDGSVYKLLRVNEELVLLKISSAQARIRVNFPLCPPSENARKEAAEYVWDWFDLDTDLSRFYQVANLDPILQPLAQQYYGLRIMCIPDLFEALTWGIIGQQINLTFAYTLKKRFVEHFGESLTFEGETFWIFPAFERIASLAVEDLRKLQFTTRKAEYVIGVAQAMTQGEVTKEKLLELQDYRQAQNLLTAMRGIGAWTADYVLMKCLHYPSAFPIADVGLHNAMKLQLGLERKPTIDEIKEMSTNWEGWQAYATFYLWRSLYA